MECAFGRFAEDTNLGRVIEDRADIQRDLNSLEKGADRNPTKLKGKCNILCWGRDACHRMDWGPAVQKAPRAPRVLMDIRLPRSQQ